MKKTNLILLFLMALAWAGCHKDKEMNAKDPVVSNVEVSVSETQARFSWQVDFAGEFQTGVEVSQDENMSDLKRVEASKLDERFVAVVDSLSEGMKYYYRIVVWNRFNTIGQEVEEFKTLEAIQDTTYYIIAVSCLPEEGGLANGGGTFAEYDTCTLTAMPNEGYYFINWTLDDSIVSTDETYSFEVTEAANYVANFELNDNDPLTYSINSDGVSVTVTGHVDGTAATGTLTIPATKTISGVTYTVTTIGEFAFHGCTGFTGSLTIPNSVTTINRGAFYGCSGFTGSLTIGSSVTTIGSNAFDGCSGFTGSLTIGDSVTTIGASAFYNCSGLTGGLTIGNSVTTIERSAFYNCRGFTGSLTIGSSVTKIGSNAFAWCSGFTGSLTIPNFVTIIEDRTFYGCSGFTGSLTIGNSVTTIGSNAFDGCSGFTGDLNIPNSVTMIAWKAFFGCSGFTGSLTIPNSVTTIGGYAFCECSGFTGSLTIPNSVTTIGNAAFKGCSGLMGSLTIPNSVTTIGGQTFSGCSGFTGNLNIPNSVDTIGWQTFSGCSGFTGNLNIPNSVTTIGNDAFYNCSGFTGSLTLGNSVTTIDFGAFTNCNGFTSVQALANTAPVVGVDYMGRDAFYGMNHTIPVIVPCGSLSSYQNATGWSEFTDIQEMCQYEISATVNPTGSGTVTGGGTYNQGQTCTLSATNNPGFAFDHWTRNGTTIVGGATISFTVTVNATYVAYFTAQSQAPEGSINGKFTINASGDKVYFSQGNLQYIGSTQTWKFADHQWDYLGDNGQGSTSQTVDRDLFGWGTSGYNHGAVCYQPWNTSYTYSDYYAYGQYTYNLYDQTGQADWGYNAISNGGNYENTGWRTLTGDSNGEWKYIFDTRSASTVNGTANARYAQAKVNNVKGVILFPDIYTHPLGVAQPVGINDEDTGWNGNNYSATDFGLMEQNGAVFLPAAGRRYGTSVYDDAYAYYWSATYLNNGYVCTMYFNDHDLSSTHTNDRSFGLSVRLVAPAE